uniref:28 kDa Metastriate family member n=1 Tax=Rhipicephalus zambeziensis TaxID=60191 RepID=A0A224YBR5_9ACAR
MCELLPILSCLVLMTSAKAAWYEKGNSYHTRGEWWEFVKNNSWPPLGENITLDAYVYYDETYYGILHDTTEYSKNLFKEAQEYLHNRSIMVNITTLQTVQVTNLSVYFENRTLDGRHTLENLTNHGRSLKRANNSVYFLFVWPGGSDMNKSIDILHDNGSHYLNVSEVSTKNTFCTNNTSAAVIRHRHTSSNYWSTVKALLDIFGSQHFIAITSKDWDNMNKTFSKCPLHTTAKEEAIGDIPVC